MRAFSDPGLRRLREAAVTMAATLLSFGSVLWLKHAVGLTSSSVLLAVVLSLSLNRQRAERPHQRRRMLLIAPALLPVFAVVASEIGTRMFTHPNLGDAMFVVGMAGAVWLRRYGDVGRRTGTLAAIVLTASLVTPGPVVPIGPGAPTRWWGAVVAVLALCWVRLSWYVAERVGLLSPAGAGVAAPPVPPRAVDGAAPWHRRLPVSTKLALQMAAALTGGFATGRAVFGLHWTWTVLTAYIVSAGNRGRGDVAQKAVLRIAGAAAGTLIATALANTFSPHNDWSVVTIFAILAVAVWLRPLSYAFWAGGVTAALALLYGFYGEQGDHLLLDRLEGILLGASIAVVAAWAILPVRNIDVIRRQLAVALRTIASQLPTDGHEMVLRPEAVALIRECARTAELAAGALRWQRVMPTAWRGGLPYAAASRDLVECAKRFARLPGHRLAMSEETRLQLERDLADARRALSADATAEQAAALPAATGRIASALPR